MINKNGKALLKINNSNSRVVGNYKIADGTEITLGGSSIFGNIALYVGSGTTEATIDDYNLESEDSDLSVISKSGTDDSSNADYNQNYIASYSGTFKNNTENDITISEIGIMATTSWGKILFAREVIEPVVIAPQKTYTFSMTIG